MTKNIEHIIIQLHNYCKNQDFKGYNLLDSNLGYVNFNIFGNKISYFISQLFRRSPINLRPLFGIKKTINPKGIGLFLYSYVKLKKYNLINPCELDNVVSELFEYLIKNYSQNYSGYCWGYQYDWSQRSMVVPAYSPCSVVTGFILRAIYTYYDEFKDLRALGIIKSASKFALNDLYHTLFNEGRCISYNTIKPDLTLNASLLAAEILLYDDLVNNTFVYKNIVKQTIDFVIDKQNKDGSWPYSLNIYTLKPHNQIDFHQGYIIDSLMLLSYKYHLLDKYIENAILCGLKFYCKLFKKNGTSYYRYPIYYPIDIHNQAQGIISFAKASSYDSKYLSHAIKIFNWTINNMFTNAGCFIFQKHKFYKNNISYMRWNQAWMLTAMVELYEKEIFLTKIYS